MRTTFGRRRGSAAARLVDVAAAVGLVAALGAVFALDKPAEVKEPDKVAEVIPPEPEPPPPGSGPGDEPLPPAPELPKAEEPPAPEPVPAAFLPKEVDRKQRLRIGLGGSTLIGLQTLPDRGRPAKRLTFSEFGNTNTTVAMVDGETARYFDEPEGTQVLHLKTVGAGTGTDADKAGGGREIETRRLADPPYVTRWRYRGVLFEQSVDPEPGEESRRMDTIRVKYTLTNEGDEAREAGIRLMVDTFIGSNDGVPYFVPGRPEVIEKPVTLAGQDVPATLLALERNDLQDAGMTVTQFRFGDNGEKPDKVVLSHWPGSNEERWEWEKRPSWGGDSAVGIYFSPKPLPPGGTRTFSFTYGLGSLAAGEPGNTAMMVRADPAAAGKPFVLTAFVANPGAGQRVKLTLPKGLRLADGEADEKPAPQRGGGVSKVDWQVVPDPTAGGTYEVTAALTGTALTTKYRVFVVNPAPVVKEVVVSGTPAPGGQVRVTAQLLNPPAGATATLVLPPGLALRGGQPAGAAVAAGRAGQASWVVDVAADKAGEAEVVVKLTGAADGRKAVDIRRPEPQLKGVVVSARPSAGRPFRVTAQVFYPAGGTVTLALPDGLRLAAGESADKPVAGGGPVAQPSWLVRADRETGPLTVRATLAHGGKEATKEAAVAVGPAVRELTVRLGQPGPVTRGKPFWVVADLSAPAPGEEVELAVPPEFRLADGHPARKPLDPRDGYGRAKWLVESTADAQGTAELTATAAGLAAQKLPVEYQRGSLIK